jgi:hypothetical protein
MQMIRRFWESAVSLTSVAGLDEGKRFPLCTLAALEELFEQVGLEEVQGREIDVRTRFSNFDDYWTPFLGGQGPAPGYVMSLNPIRRVELRERLRSDLPIMEDGSIDLVARAWAVRGVKGGGRRSLRVTT